MVMVQTKLINVENNKNTAPPADTYKGIYGSHKYWSKKPYNVIRYFISKYSKEGDVVLDPFCGSGVSIVESIFTNRKAIGVDINPSAIFITKQTLCNVDVNYIKQEFEKLKLKTMDKINSLYVVKRDDYVGVGTHYIWEDGKLIEVWYKKNKKKIEDTPTKEDIDLAYSISYENIPYFYPKNTLFYNPRINADKGMKVYELFTPRNLMALSILWHEINNIQNENIKSFFKFCFTASLGQASKMVFVVKRRGKFNGNTSKTVKKEVGSWVIGYWVPKEHFEINVWNCFENRYKRILKAKKTLYGMRYSVNEGNSFEELISKNKNLLLYNEPAQDVLTRLPPNSIDYIITDPPHGDRQPYLELSLLWNSWLGITPNYEKEIVISDSKERTKNRDNYYELLKKVFYEIERVLKPYHYFTLMFNSLDDKTWIQLFSIMDELNFELENVETLEYSAGSVVQNTRTAGLKTDFVFTFKKTKKSNISNTTLFSISQNKDFIIELVDNYIKESKQGLPTYKIINYLLIYDTYHNKLFKLSELYALLKNEFYQKDNLWVGRSA